MAPCDPVLPTGHVARSRHRLSCCRASGAGRDKWAALRHRPERSGPESVAETNPDHGMIDHTIPQCRTAAQGDGSCEQRFRRYHQLGHVDMVGILHGYPYSMEAMVDYQLLNGGSRVVGQEKRTAVTGQ